MLFVREIADRIEEHLYAHGVATWADCLSPEGESKFAVVFPMGREFDLHEGLALAQAELMSMAGPIVFTLKTVLMHFAYELFASIQRPENVFLSTSVTNLRAPEQTARRVRVLTLAQGRERPTFSKKKVKALCYKLDVVLISDDPGAVIAIPAQLRERVLTFNMDSRFLQISHLRWGWSPSRFIVGNAEPAYQELPIITE